VIGELSECDRTEVRVYNRSTKQIETEKIAGYKFIKTLYGTTFGKLSIEMLVKRKCLSSVYGKFCDSQKSRSKIAGFVRDFNIDLSSSVKQLDDFETFNDFFTRKLKPDARPIDNDPKTFIAPADSRLLVFQNIDIDSIIQVKGMTYSMSELLEDEDLALAYQGGTCLVFRLSPADYHRFHFVDNGSCDFSKLVNGQLYSVNPLALAKIPRLYLQNKREISVFHSENFGDIVYVEIGATMVGSIIQTYIPDSRVEKGSEKGYFKCGGSTVILFMEKNRLAIDGDILKKSHDYMETKVRVGEGIGRAL
jgi:phosphatidylserine decarboxylase